MMVLEKLKNRARYCVSIGSPIRTLRKAAIYSWRLPNLVERRQFTKGIALSKQQIESLATLEREGQATASVYLDDKLLAELKAAALNRLGLADGGNKVVGRKYFGELLNPETDFNPESIYVRFALQKPVLNLISAYFGYVPRLTWVSLVLSKISPDRQWLESQLWHQDLDDSKTVKLFVYLSDVDGPGDGPFTYLPAQASDRVKNKIIPGRLTDEQIQAQGLASKATPVYGKTGSSFFIDTARCYHFGSRCFERPRLAYVATFNSIASLYPNGHEFTLTPRHDALERLILKT